MSERTVHFVQQARTLCGYDPPGDWPKGQYWVGDKTRLYMVTCPGCKSSPGWDAVNQPPPSLPPKIRAKRVEGERRVGDQPSFEEQLQRAYEQGIKDNGW